MSEQDAEVDWLEADVRCAVLLERLPPVWRLDRAESTRQSHHTRNATAAVMGDDQNLALLHGGI